MSAPDARTPVWAVVVIAFDVVVIYAIVGYGREMVLLRASRSSPNLGEDAWIARGR